MTTAVVIFLVSAVIGTALYVLLDEVGKAMAAMDTEDYYSW